MAKTVGELVLAEWRDALHRWVDSHDGTTPWYHIPQEPLIEVLTRIGFWDAEVLECEFRGFDTVDMLVPCPNPGKKHWQHDLWDDDLGFKFGQRVRIIVLPEDGDDER